MVTDLKFVRISDANRALWGFLKADSDYKNSPKVRIYDD